jgi:hypothetical protein
MTALSPTEALLRLIEAAEGFPVPDHGFYAEWHSVLDDARAALAAAKPVSASDCLPGPKDCNEDGMVWCSGNCDGYETDPEERYLWALSRIEDENGCATHWLPANALPLITP